MPSKPIPPDYDINCKRYPDAWLIEALHAEISLLRLRYVTSTEIPSADWRPYNIYSVIFIGMDHDMGPGFKIFGQLSQEVNRE